ncbi:hypothetical protein RYH73_23385 [Olivibacter sp. CPCC 100613]|uniref:hypothetical protein n=1 Tax=Olivibacter sp. CPCC 100613 TaxID=3079931 RepID=UPI002FF52419
MKNRYLFLLLLFIAIGFHSCTKTEHFEVIAPNRMIEYKVVNLQDTVIYGAIDNENNTITVYVPFYLGMAVIQPEITVETGAALETEVLPVELDNTVQSYKVRGADGSSRIYQLHIIQQNTPFLSLVWSTGQPTAAPGNQIVQMGPYDAPFFASLYGDFQSTNTSTLTFALINKVTGDTIRPSLATAEIMANNSSSLPLIADYLLNGITVPDDVDSGYYDVEVGFLGHKELAPAPLHVQYHAPIFAPLWSAKVATPGGEINFAAATAPFQYLFIDPKSATTILDGKTFEFAIQSSSTKRNLVLKVPEDFPRGEHGVVPFTFQFGEWSVIELNVPLTINAR